MEQIWHLVRWALSARRCHHQLATGYTVFPNPNQLLGIYLTKRYCLVFFSFSSFETGRNINYLFTVASLFDDLRRLPLSSTPRTCHLHDRRVLDLALGLRHDHHHDAHSLTQPFDVSQGLLTASARPTGTCGLMVHWAAENIFNSPTEHFLLRPAGTARVLLGREFRHSIPNKVWDRQGKTTSGHLYSLKPPCDLARPLFTLTLQNLNIYPH